jgi:hypothetical protein
MGASSVTGVGQGSAVKASPAVRNITINDPHIIMTGVCTNIGQELPWKIRVSFPELPLDPSYYSVFVIQSDLSDTDGSGGELAPHIAKKDANENFEEDGFDSGFAGFTLRTGTGEDVSFMWMVVKNGINVRR